jgi:hypothetical protein
LAGIRLALLSIELNQAAITTAIRGISVMGLPRGSNGDIARRSFRRAFTCQTLEKRMGLNAAEREILAQLIRAVQTLAHQTLTVHLQLGAVRAILARKGTVTATEFTAALRDLDTMTLAGELVGAVPTTEDFFNDLLRRLEGLDNSGFALGAEGDR